jgi:hypothetical protein
MSDSNNREALLAQDQSAAPPAEPGYRGPGVYLGGGIASIVGAPIEGFLNGFVPVISTGRTGRVTRWLIG